MITKVKLFIDKRVGKSSIIFIISMFLSIIVWFSLSSLVFSDFLDKTPIYIGVDNLELGSKNDRCGNWSIVFTHVLGESTMTMQVFNISIQNLQDSERKINIIQILEPLSYDVNIANISLYEWKGTLTEIPIYGYINETIFKQCTDDNETYYNCSYNQTIKVQNGTKIINILQWKSAKAQALKQITSYKLKENMKLINIPSYGSESDDGTVNGTKYFQVRIFTPFTKTANGWGSSGLYTIKVDNCIFYDLENSSWWNSSWTYYRPIEANITENVTDYQFLINITNKTNAQTDCSDMRFTLEDNVTELNYWIEECNTSKDYALIWINVSLDTYNGTQIMYWYGNTTTVTSQSNGEQTFILFDNFDDDSLNASKWTTYIDGNGYVTETGGALNISTTTGSLEGAGVYSVKNFAKEPMILEMRYKSTVNGNPNCGGSDCGFSGMHFRHVTNYRDTNYGNQDDYSWGTWLFMTSTQLRRWEYNDTLSWEYFSWANSVNTWYDVSLFMNSTIYGIDIDDSTIYNTGYGTNVWSTVGDTIKIEIYNSNQGQVSHVTIDDVKLRKYVSSEPTYSIGAEESAVVNVAPTLDTQELYPASPYTDDALTLNATCSDEDAGDTLTAVWTIYKDNINQTALHGSTIVTNGTETTIYTIASGNTSKDEAWIGEVYCNDATVSSSSANTTSRTILNTAPTIPDIAPITNLNITIDYQVITCENSTDADIDTIYYTIYGDTTATPGTILQNTTSTTYNWTSLSEGYNYFRCASTDATDYSVNTTVYNVFVDTISPAVSTYYQWDSTNTTVDFGVWTDGFVSVNWNISDTTGINVSTCWIRVRNNDTTHGYTNLSYIDDLNHPDYDIITGYKNLTCYTEDMGDGIIRVSANMTRSYDWRPLNTAFDQDSAAHDNIYYSHGGRSTKIVFHNITNTINTTFIFLADIDNQSNTVADHIFYSCNLSYVDGDYTTDDNCLLVGAITTNTTRDVNFGYVLGALTTDENGSFGGVIHTSTMYGISYCPSCTNTGNAWITYSTTGYDGHSATSPNMGSTWTNLSGEEFNVILHVIDNTQLEFNLSIDDNLGNTLRDLQSDSYGVLENRVPFGDITTDNVTGNLASYYDIHGITESGTICINVTVSDPNADIMNVSIYLLNNDSSANQTLLLNYSVDGYGIICHHWDTTNVSDGDYRLNVTAHDGYLIGYDESAGYIRIANNPPIITIIAPTTETTTNHTPYLNITVDKNSNIYYNIDGGANITGCTSCTSFETILSYLTSISHTIEVYANTSTVLWDDESVSFTIFDIDTGSSGPRFVAPIIEIIEDIEEVIIEKEINVSYLDKVLFTFEDICLSKEVGNQTTTLVAIGDDLVPIYRTTVDTICHKYLEIKVLHVVIIIFIVLICFAIWIILNFVNKQNLDLELRKKKLRSPHN